MHREWWAAPDLTSNHALDTVRNRTIWSKKRPLASGQESAIAINPEGGTTVSADGTWNVAMQSPAGQQSVTFVMEEAGGAVTGTMSSGADSTQSPFSDGTVDGDNLAWNVVLAQPMPLTLEFTATVSGDSISGTAKFGTFGQGDFEGSRA
jgi:hypothetical protein